ncbi:MAG: N-acetylmuramoyl-L-alanine amidase [Chloroflexota bacterium]|nr:N-acetylmuramoyl-L-alanine amidase [Chloroflexota bacterium]
MWRVVATVLLAMGSLADPVAGPYFGDVVCPTGSAQIVLDPGHGGPDPGAVHDVYGLYEKTLTLEVAERTAEILRIDYGYSVALTRQDNDTELGNSERGAIANACGAIVFVEVHLNASLDRDINYSQTFWGEKEKDLVFSLVMNEALGALEIPLSAVDRFDNGGLLRAKMPSVLVEAVFVSNTDEAKDLANGTRQESIARAIATGVVTWMHLRKEIHLP